MDMACDNLDEWSWQKSWKFAGPGLLLSIVYLGPGNLDSQLQAGAEAGYKLIWVLMLVKIMGCLMQMLSVKLAVATELDLAQHCRRLYPTGRYVLWILLEVAIICSSIQEVVGGALAISLLTSDAVPFWAGILITAAASFCLLPLEQAGIRKLEAFFAILMGTIAACFGIMYLTVQVPTDKVVHGLLWWRVPQRALKMAIALVGAGIAPANFYLHSALVHKKMDTCREVQRFAAVAYFQLEGAVALLAALLINISVVALTAESFYDEEDVDIRLEHVGLDLDDTYGTSMRITWAVGLLAAGLSSTVTGMYTGQLVMSGLLELEDPRWVRISITRCVVLVPTLLFALLCRAPGVMQLDVLYEWLNLLQSVMIPFALLPLINLTSSREVMGGAAFCNGPLMSVAAWVIALAVMTINGLLLWELLNDEFYSHWAATTGCLICVALYLSLVLYFAIGPKRAAALLQGIMGTLLQPSEKDAPLRKEEQQVIENLPGMSEWEKAAEALQPPDAYVWHVFISHAGNDADKPFARSLKTLLMRTCWGLRVFLDDESLQPGSNPLEDMDIAMNSTAVGLLLFSKDFFERQATLRELRVLYSRHASHRVQLLPVFLRMRVEDCRHILEDKLGEDVSLPTGIRHVGERSRLQRGMPKTERETLWHIAHALSTMLGKDFSAGTASYAASQGFSRL